MGNIIQIHTSDHIIVCVFGDNNAPTVGLRNLLLPLRNSNLPTTEVKKVLLLGKKEYIEKEWKDIDEFQDVYFMEVKHVVICLKLLLQLSLVNFNYLCTMYWYIIFLYKICIY